MIVSLRLLAPLSHGAFGPSTGNTMPLRRIPMVAPGEPEPLGIPVLSGNALRGRMRRLLFRELFQQLWPDDNDKPVPGVWDRIYSCAANGGVLEGSDKTVDPARISEVRAAVPPLSLFGAAVWKWFLAGRMSVGICWPVCDATVTAGVVRGKHQRPLPSLADIEDEVSHVRLPDRDIASGSAKPMPYSFEALSAGVTLESMVLFEPRATEIERSAAAHALGLVSTLGGRVASGMGRVGVSHDGDPSVYADWLRDRTALRRAGTMLVDLAS